MSILDSFSKVNLNGASPSVSISSYGLTFNKTVVDTMELPNYVDLYLDENNKKLAIAPSDSSTSIPFCINKSNKVNARINNKEFCRKLAKLMSWDLGDASYRVAGEFIKDEKVFIFDLNSNEKIVVPMKEEPEN